VNTQKINEIADVIDALALEILGPLRSSKTINKVALQKLDAFIEELAPLLKDQESVPRVLTGHLWFIFTSMLTEAEYAKNRHEIDMVAWGLQDKLRKIYGPLF
jgi:hypothetical protein